MLPTPAKLKMSPSAAIVPAGGGGAVAAGGVLAPMICQERVIDKLNSLHFFFFTS